MKINPAIQDKAIQKLNEQNYKLLCLKAQICPLCGGHLQILPLFEDEWTDYKCVDCGTKFTN